MLIGGHVRSLRDAFSAFLQRPDDKQSNLAEFCSSFNLMDQVISVFFMCCKHYHSSGTTLTPIHGITTIAFVSHSWYHYQYCSSFLDSVLRATEYACGGRPSALKESKKGVLKAGTQISLAGLRTCFLDPERWQDLRFDSRARKELLLRTEEFRSKNWFDVEERKARATGVLKILKGDGKFVLWFHEYVSITQLLGLSAIPHRCRLN